MDETPVYFDTPREEDDMHEVDCTVCEGTFSSQRTLEIHTEMEHPNYLKTQSRVSRKPQKDEVKEEVCFPLPKGPRKNIKGRGQTIAEVMKNRHAYKDLAEQLSFVSLPRPRSKSGFVECPRCHTLLAGHLNRHLKTCNGIASPQGKKSSEIPKQKSVKPSPKVVKPSPKVVKPSTKVVKTTPKLPQPLVKNSPKVSQTVVHTRHNSRYSEEQMLSAIQAVLAGTMAKSEAARTYDVPRTSLKEATDRYIKAQKSDSDMDDDPVLLAEANPKEGPEKGLKNDSKAKSEEESEKGVKNDSKANSEEESEKGLKKDSYVHLRADAKEDSEVQVTLTTPTKLSALGLKRQPKVDERVEELNNSDFSPYNSDDAKRKTKRPRTARKSCTALFNLPKAGPKSKKQSVPTEFLDGRRGRKSSDGSSRVLPISCEYCGKVFGCKDRKANLARHLNSVHLKLKPCSCEVCDQNFTSKYSLANHEASSLHKTKAKQYLKQFI